MFLEAVGSDSNYDRAVKIFGHKEESILPHAARAEQINQLSHSIKNSIKKWDRFNIAIKEKQ